MNSWIASLTEREGKNPTQAETKTADVVSAFVCALLCVSCVTGNADDIENVGNGDVDADTDADSEGSAADAGTDQDAVSTEDDAPYTAALIVTTDYQTGAYSRISLSNHQVTKDIDFPHSDVACRFDPITNTPFLMLRLGADAVDVLDRTTFEIENEYSVEAAANPYDIAVTSNDRAYIARYGSAVMRIVKPLTGEKLGVVDLRAYADDDGLPEAAGTAIWKNEVLVVVQRIDQLSSWVPVGDSYIVRIDSESGEISGDVRLTGTNPYGALEFSNAIHQFVIAEPGSFSTLDDGGVELYDPETKAVGGFVVTEETLGGNVTKALVVSETKGYALVGRSDPDGSLTRVVTFNPKTQKKTGTVIERAEWVLTDIALTPNGEELWVTDRTADEPGIRIFDTATDKEVTEAPIDVGLPPSDICFTR